MLVHTKWHIPVQTKWPDADLYRPMHPMNRTVGCYFGIASDFSFEKERNNTYIDVLCKKYMFFHEARHHIIRLGSPSSLLVVAL